MITVTEDDVRRLLPMKEAIRLTREAFLSLAQGEAQSQPRRRLLLPSGTVLHSMAGAWGNYFGTKIYSTNPRHGAHFHFLLYEAETGKPLALFEANWLGQIRTGAASGLATDLLARPDASVLGVIGSGFQARSQVEAVLAVREIGEVRVWSRDEQKRRRFAEECSRNFGVRVAAADSARQAVTGAEVVVTATNARDPVLESDWIFEGAHVNAMGSNQARRRELPAELIRRAGLIAVDSLEQARIEAGDLLLAIPAEEWPDNPIVELHEIVAGRVGRADQTQVTVFKSIGLGLEDVAVGSYIYGLLREG